MTSSPAAAESSEAGTSPGLRPLVVKITCGAEALERLNQAMTVASTALAAGAEVSVWLTGDATWMAVAGRAEELALPHGAPLEDLRDALLTDATVTVCGQCAARRELTPNDLLEGATIRGAAAYVEEILRPNAQAIVY
ncbi:DsrE family protein [Knoellia subterranea]|uniref:DsrE family protein n=1 Tax=Knoellia subterranea KCTC 19937 TaxID=1385521 RepID=A0A0A0JLS7_9MICO|nr:DsrE family protein [Knoellia subterranea]KGN36576.1 DsrE family protein [Knoellia subterranea KCTC 19937]